MKEKNIPITQWAEEDRPREKMLAKGKKALSNSELLGIVLGSGNLNMSAVELAKKLLLSADNSLVELSKKDISDLTKENGVGNAKAVSVMAALELGSRMWAESRRNDDIVIKDSSSIYNIVSPMINELPHEEFWAIYLNSNNKLIHSKRIASGGLTQTSVDVRMILKTAIERNATAIAVAHNHPSGNVRPSKEDIALTKKIKEACHVMDIKLLDHVIVGEHFSAGQENYYSFYDEGVI